VKLFRLFFVARRALPRIVPLFRDSRVPLYLKAGAVGAALLIVSPLDLLADIPIVGLLDDVVLLMLAANLFVFLAERALAHFSGGFASHDGFARETRLVRPRALNP